MHELSLPVDRNEYWHKNDEPASELDFFNIVVEDSEECFFDNLIPYFFHRWPYNLGTKKDS